MKKFVMIWFFFMVLNLGIGIGMLFEYRVGPSPIRAAELLLESGFVVVPQEQWAEMVLREFSERNGELSEWTVGPWEKLRKI